MAGESYLFRDISLREDLQDFVSLYGRTDRPFTSVIGKTQANQIVHSWVQDVLATRALNSYVESFAFTATNPDAGLRLANVTQVMEKDVFISQSTLLFTVAGGINEVTKQVKKRTMELLNDREFNYLRATLITGNTNAARQMQGLVITLLNGTISSLASGATENSTTLSDMQNQQTNFGTNLTDIFITPAGKRKISTQQTTVTKYASSGDRILTETIAVFEGDFGVSELHVTRDFLNTMFSAQTNTNHIVGIDRSLFARAVVHEPMLERAGKRERGILSVIHLEETLEYRNAAAGTIVKALA